jgi:hypothetical protein
MILLSELGLCAVLHHFCKPSSSLRSSLFLATLARAFHNFPRACASFARNGALIRARMHWRDSLCCFESASLDFANESIFSLSESFTPQAIFILYRIYACLALLMDGKHYFAATVANVVSSPKREQLVSMLR